MRIFLAPPPTMASPFLVVPVDLCALFVQASLWRDRTDPLALSDDLFERYRFSSEGIRYLIVLVGPYVGNATQRSRALTVAQCVCVSSSIIPYITAMSVTQLGLGLFYPTNSYYSCENC